MAFFLKTIVMLSILKKTTSLFWTKKNANFVADFMYEKKLKNHNIGPWSPCSW
jgi:hypothetical protein